LKKFALSLTLKQGTKYVTKPRQALKIDFEGTDATTAGHLYIDGEEMGDIVNLVAPLHRKETNLLGPLCLGNLFYVVPEETEFEWKGPTGTKCRVEGTMAVWEPGESMPIDWAARKPVQRRHHLTYLEKTYSHGTDVKLVKDAEVVVLALTPLTPEEYRFKHPLMVSVANYTPAEGDLALRFRKTGAELEELLKEPAVGGVDVLYAPRPPKDDVEMDPFTLERSPITVLGDQTLEVRVRNIKGADISPAAGTALTFTVTAIVEYLRKE